ncbi:hypothetical protein EG68_12058 [Paragonimus skrjabini miyazakii]|uniref:Uncharacterized protein n=1 Tax=Paragonimus skrjabini miyazakii TaxID=59628 RepID=A0A8S9YCE9_9TREM|nr:hypothetical protein EG68_12058 [Paragonimus skrjabini miyazakii]
MGLAVYTTRSPPQILYNCPIQFFTSSLLHVIFVGPYANGRVSCELVYSF